ncbi:MAG: U32 family peptidase, partial [Desulfatitalea sp.]
KSVPKGGKFFFKTAKGLGAGKATPVFLIDRREPYLAEQIAKLEGQIRPVQTPPEDSSNFNLRLPPASPRQPRARLMQVLRYPGNRIRETSLALWLSAEVLAQMPDSQVGFAWWWLPPVIWPDEEAQWQQWIKQVMAKGALRFVLNAPWQVSLFPRPEQVNLWAGPFCNISNPMAVRAFKLLGGQGVIVSPELGQADLEGLAAKSVLPLGVVVSGQWPFCVSRVVAPEMKIGQPFVSPKGEQGWVQRYGGLYWVFPNWPINLRPVQESLTKAGYRLFVHLEEPIPKGVAIKKRPGNWNWEIGLK